MATQASGLSVEVAHDFPAALGDLGAADALVSREEWDQLLHSSASDVVFMTWQWQTVWWQHFGAQEGCQLHLLAIRDERGALLSIAPLFVDSAPLPPTKEYRRGELRPEGEGPPKRLVRLVGGIDVADYLDVIAPADRMADVWSVVFDYLMARRDEWDAIDLHSLPEWSPSKELVEQF